MSWCLSCFLGRQHLSRFPKAKDFMTPVVVGNSLEQRASHYSASTLSPVIVLGGSFRVGREGSIPKTSATLSLSQDLSNVKYSPNSRIHH